MLLFQYCTGIDGLYGSCVGVFHNARKGLDLLLGCRDRLFHDEPMNAFADHGDYESSFSSDRSALALMLALSDLVSDLRDAPAFLSSS